MRVSYSSNNSGGSWWLKDDDWHALENAGWTVEWCREREILGRKQERWLGALATSASKDFETPKEALEEFERVTGQRASDEGCNCCGAPHIFTFEVGDKQEYASGEELLDYLYGDGGPKDLREAYEMLKGRGEG